jgi:hypothetical protein
MDGLDPVDTAIVGQALTLLADGEQKTTPTRKRGSRWMRVRKRSG